MPHPGSRHLWTRRASSFSSGKRSAAAAFYKRSSACTCSWGSSLFSSLPLLGARKAVSGLLVLTPQGKRLRRPGISLSQSQSSHTAASVSEVLNLWAFKGPEHLWIFWFSDCPGTNTPRIPGW